MENLQHYYITKHALLKRQHGLATQCHKYSEYNNRLKSQTSIFKIVTLPSPDQAGSSSTILGGNFEICDH